MSSENNMKKELETEGQNQRHWFGTSLSSQRKYAIFQTLLRYGGLGSARVLLFFVVLIYTLRPAVVRRSLPYLSRRFGRVSFLRRWRQVWRLYWNFGNILLEGAATGILGARTITNRQDDVGRMLTLLGEGHGLIMLSGHVGLWQTGASGFPPGAIVNLAMYRGPGGVEQQFFEYGSDTEWADIRIIDPRGPFGGFVEMSAALKRGEVLGLMGDRLTENDKFKVTVDFLGGKVELPAAPYYLSSTLGTPILVIFVRRTGPMAGETLGETIIKVPPKVGRSDEALRPYAQLYADALEDFARKYPDQFFNFYDMWKN